MHPNVAKARSRVGVSSRQGDADALLNARRELATAKLEDYITRTVDAAPPLTPEDRDYLASLLRSIPTAGGHDAA